MCANGVRRQGNKQANGSEVITIDQMTGNRVPFKKSLSVLCCVRDSIVSIVFQLYGGNNVVSCQLNGDFYLSAVH